MTWHSADVVRVTNGAFGGCKWALYDMVCDYFTDNELWENGKIDRYGHKHPYFENITFHLWHSMNSKYSAAGYAIKNKCEHFCRDRGNVFIQCFLNAYYHNSLEIAIKCTETFEQLWQQLLEYFNMRKEKFMERQKAEIDIAKQTGIANKKTPQSHGGVANLLKVLTKTMEKQGADIKNIAKMQYAICKQAGIYIPDEFLTDVAVMLEATGGVIE